MEQNAEIFAVDGEFGAEFVAVGFIEKEPLQDAAVFVREFGKDLPNRGLALFGDEGGVEIDADIGQVRELFFGGGVLLLAAESFEDDVL
jgi:hypothetical protein